jgi:glyoxylase-like metal-dependent hydrolase (beta-lactamase superfamily II)
MTSKLNISRRTALKVGAALPVAGLLGATATAVTAGGHAQKAPMPSARSFTVGDFTVTTLLAGTTPRDNPQGIFGMNVSAEEFERVSAENFIPTDMAQFYFTPTLVDTGAELILFDTGLNAAGITKALAETGVAPQDINKVVITHMHGDHIGGLLNEGSPTFANASYVTGQAEFDHWAASGNERFEGNVRPLADQFSFLSDGGAVASGITAMESFGHTPGHMTYMVESAGQQLVLIADLANHPVWSLAYPDWEVRFDADKAAAAASRRKVLGMLAADRIPMIGYHMPFPAAGYVAPREDGFRYVPVSYQMM